MKTLLIFLTTVSVSVLFSSCKEAKPKVVEKPTPATMNIETSKLGSAIDAYVASPSTTQAVEVDRAFREIDGEIAELDQRVTRVSGAELAEAKAKANNLRVYRDKERLRYTEAQVRAKTQLEKEKVQGDARKAGDGVKDAAEAVKHGVENAVEAVKEKLP